EYDSTFRWKQGEGNPTLDLLVELLPEFPEQIMLGMDAARASYWASYGGAPGLTYLLSGFVEMLRERGIGQDLIRRMFVDNPKAAFAFGQRIESGRSGRLRASISITCIWATCGGRRWGIRRSRWWAWATSRRGEPIRSGRR